MSTAPSSFGNPTHVIESLSDQNPLNGLSAEQKSTLDDWLFLKKLEPNEILQKIRDQFALQTASAEHLMEYQRVVGRRRNLRSIEQGTLSARRTYKYITDEPRTFFEQAMREIAEHEMTVCALMAHDPFRAQRHLLELFRLKLSVRHEEVYERNHNLRREQWEHDAARLCLEMFEEIAVLLGEDRITEEEKIQTVRRRLFGNNLPE